MIVFALRHAERQAGGADALSSAGKKRAELLARMLAESGVRLALCSDAARTQQTAAPLVAAVAARGSALELAEVRADGPDGIDGHVRDVLKRLRALPTEAVAVVVGHTNTIGPILKGLCGQDPAAIAESEFDKLFAVATTGAQGMVTLMRYGEKTT
jgi:phosphohistidine phosphatase SixA